MNNQKNWPGQKTPFRKRSQVGLPLLLIGALWLIGQLDTCSKGGSNFHVINIIIPAGMVYLGFRLLRKPKGSPPEAVARTGEPPAPPPVRDTTDEPALRKMVLLVDDSTTIQQAVRLGMSNVDMGVRACNPNDNILNLMHRLMPSVVMMKLDQRGNTLHLARKIRSKVEFDPIRLILMCGEENQFSPDEAKQAGVDAILPVPFDSQDLLAALGLEPALRRVKGRPVVTLFARPKPRAAAVADAGTPAEPHPLYTQPPPIVYEPPPTTARPPAGPPAFVTPPDETVTPPAPAREEPPPPPTRAAASSVSEPEAEDEPEPDPKKKLLLLIENDRAVKAEVRAMLPADRWSCRVCGDGKQAVETALRYRPAAVASRREPPGESGIEISRAIKLQRELAGVRCIILLGENEILDEFQAQMAGVDRILNRSATAEEWRRALEA